MHLYTLYRTLNQAPYNFPHPTHSMILKKLFDFFYQLPNSKLRLRVVEKGLANFPSICMHSLHSSGYDPNLESSKDTHIPIYHLHG